MLFVDTGSLLLLGLSSLKLASFLSINNEVESEINDLNQKYQNNINVINKFALYSMYSFVFIAFLQFFVVFNGLTQLDFLYSERVLKIEKKFQINQQKLESNTESKLEKNNEFRVANQNKKDEVLNVITEQKNSAISYLVRDVLKVFLMSLVWAYGLFKLSRFS